MIYGANHRLIFVLHKTRMRDSSARGFSSSSRDRPHRHSETTGARRVLLFEDACFAKPVDCSDGKKEGRSCRTRPAFAASLLTASDTYRNARSDAGNVGRRGTCDPASCLLLRTYL